MKPPLKSPSFSPAHDFLPYSMPLQQAIIIYSGPTVKTFITLLLVQSYFYFCTKQKKKSITNTFIRPPLSPFWWAYE